MTTHTISYIDDDFSDVPSPRKRCLQRLWLDSRDRWLNVSADEVRGELARHLGAWNLVQHVLESGCEIHTRYAHYRKAPTV